MAIRYRDKLGRFTKKGVAGAKMEMYTPRTKKQIIRRTDQEMRQRAKGHKEVDRYLKGGQMEQSFDGELMQMSNAEKRSFYRGLVSPMVGHDKDISSIVADNIDKLKYRLVSSVAIFGTKEGQDTPDLQAEWHIPYKTISEIQEKLNFRGVKPDNTVYLENVRRAENFGGWSISGDVKVKKVTLRMTITKQTTL